MIVHHWKLEVTSFDTDTAKVKGFALCKDDSKDLVDDVHKVNCIGCLVDLQLRCLVAAQENIARAEQCMRTLAKL